MEYLLRAPTAHVCRECGTEHGKDEPHEVRSVYYRMIYYRENGRFPEKAHVDSDK